MLLLQHRQAPESSETAQKSNFREISPLAIQLHTEILAKLSHRPGVSLNMRTEFYYGPLQDL
jgi:hypothetical protein